MKQPCAAVTFTAILGILGAFSASAQPAQSDKDAPATKTVALKAEAHEYPIPFKEGPSWLSHLKLSLSQTRMGQVGGSVPLSSTSTGLKSIIERFLLAVPSNSEKASAILDENFQASGADLYRWNCQSCHGADGKGAEPEINSVIGPVQGTSPTLTRKRMEARGIDTDDDMIKEVSDLAAASLRDRLQHGGKSMPAFEYLRGDEVEALVGYLEKLSNVPPTKRDNLVVPETATRAGEHIIRGTCHICHDAQGASTGHLWSLQGNIPSLANISTEGSLSGIVHQVQYGSTSMMKIAGANMMPAYPYFSNEEIAAVYLAGYSTRYTARPKLSELCVTCSASKRQHSAAQH